MEAALKLQIILTIKGYPGLINALNQQPIRVPADANNWSKYARGIFTNCGTSLERLVSWCY
jgi:hypothetical protein